MKKNFYSYVAKMRVTYSLTTYSLLTFDSQQKSVLTIIILFFSRLLISLRSTSKTYYNMNVAGLQNVWQTIMGFNLTAANKRWLADHLYEQAMREEALLPYTMEEIDARLDMAEEDVAAGRVYSKAEVSDMMDDYIQKHL